MLFVTCNNNMFICCLTTANINSLYFDDIIELQESEVKKETSTVARELLFSRGGGAEAAVVLSA